MNPNVIIKMIHDKNSDIILNLFICLLFIGFSASSVLLFFKLAHNVLRVGDVALCCACGKVILLKRCYGQA